MSDPAQTRSDFPAAQSDRQALEAARGRIAELERRLAAAGALLAARQPAASAPVVAESPFRMMMEQIGEGALTLHRNGLVTYCNSRFADMLDVPRERIIGQDLRHFLRVSDHARFETLLHAATDEPVRDELVLGAPGGNSLPVAITLSLIRRYGSEPLICAVTSDLTDQKQQDYTLHEVIQRLEAESVQRAIVEEALRQSQKMEAIGQLTGGLAHDFNNMLTAVLGALEQMQVQIRAGRTDRLERYVEAARQAADRAAGLTHRLLAFARRQPLDPSRVSPARLAEGMLDMVQRTVGPRVMVTLDIAHDSGATLCDGNQLENALLNLAINARDAMPDGGTLRLSVRDVALGPEPAALRDLAPGDYVLIEVADDGEGMAPDTAARAFDPFFTTKPVGQGTGLGLSTIYGFARQSGGQAAIASVPGEGTTISLFLPRLADTPAPSPPEAATVPAG